MNSTYAFKIVCKPMMSTNMFKWSILVVLFAATTAYSNVTSSCTEKEVCSSYLDMAIDMISKAKDTIPTCNNSRGNMTIKVADCADLLRRGYKKSGVYTIWPMSRVTEGKSIDVYCDMDTSGGGWTVIQRRGNFQRPKDFFYKDWKSYKEGFGDIEKDFWLGNDNIFALTNQKLYSARFDLEDVEKNKRYAQYDKFWIDDEDHKYTLHIFDFRGDAGDSMIPGHNDNKFSTKDQDNDVHKEQHCSQVYKGGWWYKSCHTANLNGLYLRGKHKSFADGVEWNSWKGYHESLEWTEIKIRPKNFRLPISDQASEMIPV